MSYKNEKNNQLKLSKNILSLSASEAKEFLLSDGQYHTFDLPKYFNFTEVLKQVEKQVGDKPFEACVYTDPGECEGVNYSFMQSKDGMYGVRPFSLTNPYLYYFLVREICSEENWSRLQKCFNLYSVPSIEACSLPVIPLEDESFKNATTILNWWNGLEQRTIELSLDYQYMFISDVTNCYGTIKLSSIDKALSLAGTSKKVEGNHDMAKHMQHYLSAMQQGNTTGIPQGSVLYDFVAEIVLGYSDLLLAERLKQLNVEDYKVIRYRDDYRIFSNSREVLETISYELQEVLESLGMRMNTKKTRTSETLIVDALKDDKRDYIYNTPIFNKKGCDFDGLQKHLYFIYEFGHEHRNGGQLPTLLTDFEKRLKAKKEIRENVHAMVSIAVHIALENVSYSALVIGVISRLISAVKDEEERLNLMRSVVNRLMSCRNMPILEVWMQNLTYTYDRKEEHAPYSMPLCRMAMGEKVAIWNNAWLKEDFMSEFSQDSIVNREMLTNLTSIVETKAARDYEEAAIVQKSKKTKPIKTFKFQ